MQVPCRESTLLFEHLPIARLQPVVPSFQLPPSAAPSRVWQLSQVVQGFVHARWRPSSQVPEFLVWRRLVLLARLSHASNQKPDVLILRPLVVRAGSHSP